MTTLSIARKGGLALLACLGAGLSQARDLVLAENQPPEHILVQSEQMMSGRLDELTKGTLKLDIKVNGVLGDEAKAWAGIKAGTLEMARVNLATLSKDLPSVKLLSLPYLFRSRDHMWSVLEGDFGKRLISEAEKNGAVVLTYYDSGTRSFYSSKRAIRSVEDFKGLRIRVQDSPVNKELITSLGATPVVLPYDKVAEAFRDGTIDAAENNTPSYVSTGHYKLAKYYSLDEHSSVPEVLVMSRKAWSSLTPAQQTALRQAATESATYMRRLWAESETQSLAKAKKEGVVVTEKSQIAMSGIESFAVKLYSKFVTDSNDLETVVNILRTK